ncbi:NUDIX domain-containing protein [Streptomyces stelliscabiei]|uniref:NUDIX domain-containing protein n=1 Tax=Streptomyces stelliscabiei TaxID=146820 RepID=UPI003A939E3C
MRSPAGTGTLIGASTGPQVSCCATSGTHPGTCCSCGRPGTQHGGTWGLPGGALRWEEHPYTGAVREAVEEMGPLPE